MTDLRAVPEAAEIPRLYHELARLGARVEGQPVRWRHGRPTPEELVVLAAQASRREPRLLWVVVELLATRFDAFDPLKLRRAAARARWPAALAVALEFAREAAPSEELEDYARFVTARVPVAGGERFFLATRAFGGEQARRDAEESLAEYKRWGYLGRELPFAKELATAARGRLGPVERRNLLHRIAARRGAVTLHEYLDALNGRASSRQASRDLAGADFLVRRGRTRGAIWRYVDGKAGKRPGALSGRPSPARPSPTGRSA